MDELLHLTERATWAAALATGEYRTSTKGVTLEQEGFIHCSRRHQLRPVAEYLYGDSADELVLLVIDADRLTVPVRFEAPEPDAEEYPHVYGPIPIEAVAEVLPVTRDENGRLLLPE
jgi:uncharacterized protein (DUF952 family)